MYNAIILAGGESSKNISKDSASVYEAMIDINGSPMVTFVAKALSMSSKVKQIYVVGPKQELERYCNFPKNTTIVDGGCTILETIQKGMRALTNSEKVLVATADIPLLTVDAIEDFLLQCSKYSADFYYPIVKKEHNDYRYPGNKRTYVKIKEGTFTGGNIFLVNPLIVPKCLSLAEPIINNRKNPLKLCQILGWRFVIKFILGTLTLKGLEQRVSELLRIRGCVIQSAYPELGIDVDKPGDLELVKASITIKA